MINTMTSLEWWILITSITVLASICCIYVNWLKILAAGSSSGYFYFTCTVYGHWIPASEMNIYKWQNPIKQTHKAKIVAQQQNILSTYFQYQNISACNSCTLFLLTEHSARKDCNIHRFVMFHHWQREGLQWESTNLV